ncbi:MAG: PEP-CTERM sorting domain-containing protein [Gemmataceae bacterium]
MRHRTLAHSIVAALAVVALSARVAPAQTFFDTYNRSSLQTGGPPPGLSYSGDAPTTAIYSGSASSTAGSGTNLVAGSFFGGANARMVQIISNAPANSSGGAYYTGTYSGGGFNSQLNQNTTVSWALNMKTSTASLGGFGTGQGQQSQFGIATVLAATSNDLTTANGYAIIRGRNGNSDRYDLIQFTGGLDNENNFTSIVSGQPNQVGPTNFTSVRVTYNGANNNWTLFVRDDGATAAGDPTNLTGYNQIGSPTQNSTYTTVALPNFGFYWNYGAGNTAQGAQSGYYDNFQAVYVPVPEPVTVLGLAAGSLGLVAGIRRRFC